MKAHKRGEADGCVRWRDGSRRRLLLVSTCKDWLSWNEFVDPLVSFDSDAQYMHWSGLIPSDIARSTHIIICGTSLADFEYLKGDWSWILDCGRPVLGICAGAQVIAKEAGWKLVKRQRIGVQNVELVENTSLLEKDAQGYFLHSYDITGGEVLAKSEGVPCLLKVKGKRIFACVFHPEVMTESIVRNFLEKDLNK